MDITSQGSDRASGDRNSIKWFNNRIKSDESNMYNRIVSLIPEKSRLNDWNELKNNEMKIRKYYRESMRIINYSWRHYSSCHVKFV